MLKFIETLCNEKFCNAFQDSVDPNVDRMRRTIDDVVLSQQTSLEILTNVCCDESGNDDWEEADIVSCLNFF